MVDRHVLDPGSMRWALSGALALACLGPALRRGDECPPAAPVPSPAAPTFRALVFSRTAGFRHQSIPTGGAAVAAVGAAHDFAVEATEDASAFSDVNLARFRVAVFLNTTGDVLDDAQQAAFERYIRGGGGFVGIHSASDTEYDWGWYHGLLGATFKNHPAIQEAVVNILDRTHVSTRDLAPRWLRTDEWYNHRASPPADAHLLAAVDEATYTGGEMGALHPVSWFHAYDGGRAWYTAMGHTACSYAESAFLGHLLGGILWAAGAE
jgi:type 1 glutamine amidotransferase